MTTPTATPVFASVQDALVMLQDAASYLAHAAPAEMPAAVQADALRGYERVTSMVTAGRSAVLRRFWADEEYHADGDGGPRPWLMRETRITGPAAGWQLGWVRRLARRPRMAAMMADGILPESVAQKIDKGLRLLPDDAQDEAEKVLLDAWADGADMAWLAALLAGIQAAAAGPDHDEPAFTDGWVRLDTTLDGAGYLRGSLSPECTALLGKVLDSLGAKTSPEDPRSEPQRHHDALQQAARWLGKCIVNFITEHDAAKVGAECAWLGNAKVSFTVGQPARFAIP